MIGGIISMGKVNNIFLALIGRSMSSSRTILITGFEPFGDVEINPTEKLVNELHHHLVPRTGVDVDTMVLPVTSEASSLVNEKFAHGYDIVLHFGLHAKIDDFALERVALNIDDYRIPDNRGDTISDRPIDLSGENAYFVSLPVRVIEDALIENGIPCHVSYSAGTYLCNHLLYTTLHYISRHELATRAGFIHIPPLEMMEFETMMHGVLVILQALGMTQ